MSNIGKTIQDNFCSGAFGRDLFLEGSRIEAEAHDWVLIRTPLGTPLLKVFTDDSWPGLAAKQDVIDEWCAVKSES